MKKKLLLIVATCSLLALISNAVQAAPIYFNDRTVFEAAAGSGLGFESFENYTTDLEDVTILDDFNVNGNGFTPYSIYRFSTEGTRAIAYTETSGSLGSTWTFNNTISAFGIDINMAHIFDHGELNITTDSGLEQLMCLERGENSFWGVIDYDGINALRFDFTEQYLPGLLEVGFDAVSYGEAAPVPEPTTMVLFGIGLLGLAGVSRRKK